MSAGSLGTRNDPDAGFVLNSLHKIKEVTFLASSPRRPDFYVDPK